MRIWDRNTIDLKKYESERIVIHCDTEEKANDLLKYLNEQGIKWNSGLELTENNYYVIYNEFTCYNQEEFGCLSFSPIDWYTNDEYNIVEWEIVDENQQGNNMINTKINWEDFINGEFAIHCKRESEVNELLRWIYKFNEENKIVNSPLAILGEGWGTEKEDICYYVNYGYINYCEKSYCNGTILEWNNKYE